MAIARRLHAGVCVLAMMFSTLAMVGQEIPPQDRGADGLVQMLRRLHTTARMLHTTAHPDDDDGTMLVYESRGRGVNTVMLQLNRGEGGQNKFGAALFDELGILRTLELLEADRYYGVQERFTKVVDFGFSKSAEETFEKWGGRDTALADMVRVIRTFRPDVIVSRFDGSARDGHGNHQAAGILSREAFRAAADPNRFPEQIREGLLPWQVRKLYVGNIRQEDVTLKIDVGQYDPVLGMSFAQYSMIGLGHQISQGVAGFPVPPGKFDRNYKLVDSVLPRPAQPENDFFDGIDTTIVGLASRTGSEEGSVPFLRPTLAAIQKSVEDATAAFSVNDPSRCAAPLLAGLKQVNALLEQVKASPLSPTVKGELSLALETKRRQLERAANLALATEVTASVDSTAPPAGGFFFRQEQTFQMAVPGQTFTVTAHFYNRGQQSVAASDIELVAPQGWQITKLKSEGGQLGPNEQSSAQFRVTVAGDAPYTRPYWHRDDPQQNVYTIDQPQYATLPLPPPPLSARVTYTVGDAQGQASTTVVVKYVDPTYGQSQKPMPVGPPFSVLLDPPVQVVSTRRRGPATVTVSVHSDIQGATRSTLRLQPPAGWSVTPASQSAEFSGDGELKDFSFRVSPGTLREGMYKLKASLEFDGKQYSEGYHVIGRHDIGDFYYYRPAEQRISAVEVNVPSGLRVGYVTGAGDEIPAVLQQLGINVEFISPGELAAGDLSQYHTIVLGIRAYDVRTDVRAYNSRLLDYVKDGGTLMVQYNSSEAVFNQGHFTPYPATLSRDRVTVEEAPVKVLEPANPIFRSPNLISDRDFSGWVQERGLYFMSKWDPQFKPLLACNDPGEPPREGGLLAARYGKGLYIYNGYAFFRQLPAGVPGAVRLYVNLLSASATPAAAHGKR